jgi:hypothetical protein
MTRSRMADANARMCSAALAARFLRISGRWIARACFVAIPGSTSAQDGVLGFGSTVYDSAWNDVPYAQMALGSHNTAALRGDGSLVVWGLDVEGQCQVPRLPAGTSYVDVVLGSHFLGDHVLALRSDGSIVGTSRVGHGRSRGCLWRPAERGLQRLHRERLRSGARSRRHRVDPSLVARPRRPVRRQPERRARAGGEPVSEGGARVRLPRCGAGGSER